MLGKLLETSLAVTASNTIVCDNVEALGAFDGPAYMGVWYEIQHSKWQPYGNGKQVCTVADYNSLNLDDGTFVVHNTSQENFEGRYGIFGTGKVTGNGQVIVNFYGPEPTEPNYLILDTDYDTYALTYFCETDDEAA